MLWTLLLRVKLLEVIFGAARVRTLVVAAVADLFIITAILHCVVLCGT